MEVPVTNHDQRSVIVCEFCNKHLDQMDQVHLLLEQCSSLIETIEAAAEGNRISGATIATVLAMARDKMEEAKTTASIGSKGKNYLMVI